MWQWISPTFHRLLKFLLTHPVWDVTQHLVSCFSCSKHFYSHIPCGMWRRGAIIPWLACKFLLTHPVWDVTAEHNFMDWWVDISTHTSRVGCDSDVHFQICKTVISTHTSRVGCDGCFWFCIFTGYQISTHTSRVGCDDFYPLHLHPSFHFYSHIPCGMWHEAIQKIVNKLLISTHTSRVGCDLTTQRLLKQK